MSRRLFAASAAVIAALSFTAPTPALAATPAACTVGGVAVPDGQPAPADIPTVMSCFDTVADAEQFIEDGAPGDYEQLYPTGANARTASTAAAIMVGKIWTGTSRSGSVLIHWGSGSGCTGVTFGFPNLGSGWNNNVRSAEGFNNCWSSQYDGTSYTGTKVTCTPYCGSLGVLDAKTSSIVYRPVGTFG